MNLATIDELISELTKLRRAIRLLGESPQHVTRVRVIFLKIISRHMGPGTRDLAQESNESLDSYISSFGLGANVTSELKNLRKYTRTSRNTFGELLDSKKYPDFYYNLSKKQQWKFRKRNDPFA